MRTKNRWRFTATEDFRLTVAVPIDDRHSRHEWEGPTHVHIGCVVLNAKRAKAAEILRELRTSRVPLHRWTTDFVDGSTRTTRDPEPQTV